MYYQDLRPPFLGILALFSLVWSMLTMESGRVEILYILWDMAEARSPTSRD